MPVAVLPAAGSSRRMGRAKLLLPWSGGTIVGAVVASLRQGGAAAIVLVTAPADTELRTWAAALGEGSGLILAVNPAPERGMLSTIREGIAALGGAKALARRGEVLLVAPADLPALRAATVIELLRRQAASGAPLAVPVHRGRRGHPLAIAPALLGEIDALDPAVGLRQLLACHAAELLEVAVDDPGAVADVDTPQDYQLLLAAQKT
ncbi:MAG TPA: nucleotidyltransferase family protein [Thermoanaerobaculia bacterium]|nr:nucleotidyltransferase family protein [Thermoanaerobaculia bacterium]